METYSSKSMVYFVSYLVNEDVIFDIPLRAQCSELIDSNLVLWERERKSA